MAWPSAAGTLARQGAGCGIGATVRLVQGCLSPATQSLVVTTLGSSGFHDLLGPGANGGTALGWVTVTP